MNILLLSIIRLALSIAMEWMEKYNAASNMRETGQVNMFISRTFMLIPDMLLWISTIAGTGNGFVMTGKEICWKKENWSILSSPSLRRSIIWFPVECPRRSINTL